MKTGYIWTYQNTPGGADFIPQRAYFVRELCGLNFWVNKPPKSNCYHITIMECGLSCCKLTNSANYKQAMEAAWKYIEENINVIIHSYNNFCKRDHHIVGQLKLLYKTAAPTRLKRMMRADFLCSDDPYIIPT